MTQPCLPTPKTRIALAAAALAAGAGFADPALAKTPAGGEFRANSFTTGTQASSAIAMDADGDFVVVWNGPGAGDETGNGGVFAQRYNATGVAQGTEFRVNTYTTGTQNNHAVAMDAEGDFVVVWQTTGQDDPSAPTTAGVYGQRYNAAGVAQGAEFLVNTRTTGNQGFPSVAMNASGNFVVTWQSAGQDDPSNVTVSGIYVQRYDAAGSPQGGEVQVNTYTTNNQSMPAVAMDATGNFAVTWQSVGQDLPSATSGIGIYARRYNAAGVAQGGEIPVNTHVTGNQSATAIAMDTGGNFVITWQSLGQDEPSQSLFSGVYAQRYNALGATLGGEFRVNSYITANQLSPAVAMDADGDLVVAWSGAGSSDAGGIFAQRYNPAGVAQGGEFRVNTYNTGTQTIPVIAMDADGDFAMAWSGQGDGDSEGIYAQRYQAVTLTPNLTVTTSGAATNTTPVAGGPAGVYSFNAQFCNNVAQTMTGLSSKTLTLTNGNNLLNRTRDAIAAPGASAIPAGGPGTEKDVVAGGGYGDMALAPSECVTVPYQIGLQNRNKFNFTVRIRGDNGM